MLNKQIFHELYAPHKSRTIAGFDSIVSTGSCSIGFIAGDANKINAIVTETATDADNWYVVNIESKNNGVPSFDSIGVLGAIDGEEASNLVQLHFGRMFDSIVTDVMETNTQGLKRNLDNSYYSLSKNKQIKPWQLAECQNVLLGEKPEWDSIQIVSHDSNNSKFLLDLQKHDDNHELIHGYDSIGDLLINFNVEVAEFDAIYTEYQYLDKFMGMLHTAMNHAQGNIKILTVETSKPFKRQGVVQIAVMYKFDDGQTLTVFFQNPDSTPSQLTSKDIVISWKYLLNKRDITGAVQPNQGEGISLPVLAGRLMKLVNLNSSRFARTQAKKLKDQQTLNDISTRIDTKKEQLKNLDIMVEDLKSQIDTIMTATNNSKSNQLADNDPNNTSPSKTEEELKLEAEAKAKAEAEAKEIDEAEAEAKAEAQAKAEAEAQAKAEELQNMNTSTYTEEEITYLNSIISGEIKPLDVDIDKIIDIGEKDESNQLFIDALSIIDNAIDKATALEQ